MRCPVCKGKGTIGDRLAPRLKNLREGRGWSQNDVGRMLKEPVSGSTIGRWENETAEPGIGQALELAQLFDVNIVELITPAKRGSHGGDGLSDHGSEAACPVDASRSSNGMGEGNGSAGGNGAAPEEAEEAAVADRGSGDNSFGTLN